jgi:endo-1,3-1,4-beta-glycanase ExoK
MRRKWLAVGAGTFALALSGVASAVASAELYQTQTFTYGRFEARTRFAAGDGVISSFFLWKPGSEVPGTFWNELDFEKLGADCRLQTNPLYGAPLVDRGLVATVAGDLCNEYHTYTFEWTPSYIAWLVDGVEVRREAGETAAAFAANAASGMQIHFNIWPGDVTFGGAFEPTILPVHQYISWVQYSSFSDGVFTLEWREDFTLGALPSGWATGNWASPKNLSTHAPGNAGFVGGAAVLSLTDDSALGFNGQPPADAESAGSGAGGSASGGSGSGGTGDISPATGGTSDSATSGASGSGGQGGSDALVGAAGAGASSGGAEGGLAYPAARQRGESGCGIAAPSPRARFNGLLVLGIAALAVRRRSVAKPRTACVSVCACNCCSG